MNLAEPSINFFSSHNMDEPYLRTFVEHFALVNPWNNTHWAKVGSGVVALSEDVAPARLFARTEFYSDWLAPQSAEAAAGVKMNGDAGQTIQLSVHFPLSRTDAYDRAITEVMVRTRGNLLRSIEVGRLLRRGSENATARASLIERGHCAAFVIDGNHGLCDANQQAVNLFPSGRPFTVKHGKVRLSVNDADERFGKVVSALSRGLPVDGSRISFRDADAAWQVVLAGLPVQPWSPGVLSLLPPRRLVLVLVTELTANGQGATDITALTAAFGLTRSEVSFCRQLLLGDSVADAADHLGITVETARTRLKTIFQKTGTSRQGQLMLLLSRLQ